MKQVLIIVMFLAGAACTFGAGRAEKTFDDNISVITGDWHEADISELNEAITDFIKDYIKKNNSYNNFLTEETILNITIDHVWTQLVEGRRYLIPYQIMVCRKDETGSSEPVYPPGAGLLILRRNFNGVIILENEYRHSWSLLNFIEMLLTGEMGERESFNTPSGTVWSFSVTSNIKEEE